MEHWPEMALADMELIFTCSKLTRKMSGIFSNLVIKTPERRD